MAEHRASHAPLPSAVALNVCGPLIHIPLWAFIEISTFCLKIMVFVRHVDTDKELLFRIIAASGKIRDTPNILNSVQESFLCQCQLCYDNDGCHFEQLL